MCANNATAFALETLIGRGQNPINDRGRALLYFEPWEAKHSLGKNVECMYHLFDEDIKCLCYDL